MEVGKIMQIDAAVVDRDADVPIYAATNGNRVWRDRSSVGGAIAAAFNGSGNNGVEELDERPDADWFTVELMDGDGIYYARHADDTGLGEIGDTPGEAASYLLNEESESYQPVTTADTLDQQIEDIVASRVTDLYEAPLIRWLVNPNHIGGRPSLEEVDAAANALTTSDDSPVSKTSYGEYRHQNRS